MRHFKFGRKLYHKLNRGVSSSDEDVQVSETDYTWVHVPVPKTRTNVFAMVQAASTVVLFANTSARCDQPVSPYPRLYAKVSPNVAVSALNLLIFDFGSGSVSAARPAAATVGRNRKSMAAAPVARNS